MSWAKQTVDILFAAGLFINAVLFIPQAFRIFKNKNGEDISLTTFIGFLLIQLTAVFYGYFHNDHILMIGYLLSLTTCGTVTGLALKYRKPRRA